MNLISISVLSMLLIVGYISVRIWWALRNEWTDVDPPDAEDIKTK